MADNFDPKNEIQIGNRRLRKIKRPKQHNGPLTVQNMADAFSSPTNSPDPLQAAFEQQVSEPVNQTPAYVETDSAYENNEQNTPAPFIGDSIEKKKVIGIAIACLFFGLLIGKFFFSGSQVVQNGLQGVILNPEVPKGRSRCGVAEKTQGCVLYVMNPQRQELNGRDFYDLASQLTGRQRFVIETGNMRYASYKIKPGAIAQLNIPPLQ